MTLLSVLVISTTTSASSGKLYSHLPAHSVTHSNSKHLFTNRRKHLYSVTIVFDTAGSKLGEFIKWCSTKKKTEIVMERLFRDGFYWRQLKTMAESMEFE